MLLYQHQLKMMYIYKYLINQLLANTQMKEIFSHCCVLEFIYLLYLCHEK